MNTGRSPKDAKNTGQASDTHATRDIKGFFLQLGVPEDFLTPANAFTAIRIIFIPVYVLFAVLARPFEDLPNAIFAILTFVLFCVLCATDKVDGYLARSRNEVSDLGKFLDPIADKILVCAALLLLLQDHTVNVWFVLIILTREFLISALRMLASSKGVVIAADTLGKIKTACTMASLIGYYAAYVAEALNLTTPTTVLFKASGILMIISVIFTVISAVQYFYNARHIFLS